MDAPLFLVVILAAALIVGGMLGCALALVWWAGITVALLLRDASAYGIRWFRK